MGQAGGTSGPPNGLAGLMQVGGTQSGGGQVFVMAFPTIGEDGSRLRLASMLLGLGGEAAMEQVVRAVVERSLEEQSGPPIPPANESVRDALPRVVVTKEDMLDSTNAKCLVCLEEYKAGSRATRMLCGHLFCTACIREWLRHANSCPVCRFELATDCQVFEPARAERMQGRTVRLRDGELQAMRIGDLKKLMRALGISGDGCVEKCDLIRRMGDAPGVVVSPDRPDARYKEPELLELELPLLRGLMERYRMQPVAGDMDEHEERVEAVKRFAEAGWLCDADEKLTRVVKGQQSASSPSSGSSSPGRIQPAAASPGRTSAQSVPTRSPSTAPTEEATQPASGAQSSGSPSSGSPNSQSQTALAAPAPAQALAAAALSPLRRSSAQAVPRRTSSRFMSWDEAPQPVSRASSGTPSAGTPSSETAIVTRAQLPGSSLRRASTLAAPRRNTLRALPEDEATPPASGTTGSGVPSSETTVPRPRLPSSSLRRASTMTVPVQSSSRATSGDQPLSSTTSRALPASSRASPASASPAGASRQVAHRRSSSTAAPDEAGPNASSSSSGPSASASSGPAVSSQRTSTQLAARRSSSRVLPTEAGRVTSSTSTGASPSARAPAASPRNSSQIPPRRRLSKASTGQEVSEQ